MGVRWKKVAQDFWSNKSRIILVILAIFFGVFGTGLILDLYSITQREMDYSYMATNPYSFSIRLSEYDEDLIAFLSSMEGIENVEARRTARARTEIAPEVWLTSYLYVIEDFNNVQIDTFNSVEGGAIPGAGKVLLEKESLAITGKQIGDALNMKISLNEAQKLTIAGSVHAPGLKPAWMEKVVYGFISEETLDLLGAPSENCDLLFVVSNDIRFDKSIIKEIAFTVRDLLTSDGYTVNRVTVPTPGKHPNGDQMNALLFLFQVFGVLSLILSGVLVVNMISSMLSGQIRQIAVMKAVGAKRLQLAEMYYVIVLASGIIALVLAIPLAVMAARAFVDICAAMLNFSVTGYDIPCWSFVLQIIAGLLVPALAASYPIMKGTQITVCEALRDYGISKKQFGNSWPDRCLGKIKGASPFLLPIRNTFRRRGRLVLTVATLAVGGAILIISLNVKSSLDNTVYKAMDALNYDLQYYFSTIYPEDEIKATIEQVPGVAEVETLAGTMSTMVYKDGTESNAFQLAASPYDLETLNFPILKGRWLESGDTNAIVLNHAYLDKEPNLKIGDTITIKSNSVSVDWVIVGIVKEVGSNEKAYVSSDYYQEIFGQKGYVRLANIITTERTLEQQEATSVLIEASLRDAGFDVMLSGSFSNTKDVFDNHFAIIAGFLVAASVLVIIVGVMGLISSMGMSVIERMREIGIMRSYGAKSRDVLHIIILEGVFTGIISWVISFILSIPFTYVIGDTFGGIFLQTPLDNVLNPLGYIVWLVIIVVITVLVSFGAALKALEMPVNEVLNYE